jgi:hypothetical protein
MIVSWLKYSLLLGVFTSSGVVLYAIFIGAKSSINWSWAKLGIFVGLLSYGEYLILSSTNIAQAEKTLGILFLGGFFVPTTFLEL